MSQISGDNLPSGSTPSTHSNSTRVPPTQKRASLQRQVSLLAKELLETQKLVLRLQVELGGTQADVAALQNDLLTTKRQFIGAKGILHARISDFERSRNVNPVHASSTTPWNTISSAYAAAQNAIWSTNTTAGASRAVSSIALNGNGTRNGTATATSAGDTRHGRSLRRENAIIISGSPLQPTSSQSLGLAPIQGPAPPLNISSDVPASAPSTPQALAHTPLVPTQELPSPGKRNRESADDETSDPAHSPSKKRRFEGSLEVVEEEKEVATILTARGSRKSRSPRSSPSRKNDVISGSGSGSRSSPGPSHRR